MPVMTRSPYCFLSCSMPASASWKRLISREIVSSRFFWSSMTSASSTFGAPCSACWLSMGSWGMSSIEVFSFCVFAFAIIFIYGVKVLGCVNSYKKTYQFILHREVGLVFFDKIDTVAGFHQLFFNSI